MGELAHRLQSMGWVTELFVGGSAVTGDYLAAVSDLDRNAAAGLTWLARR